MELTCHRCGGGLPGESLRGFCPHCGAPQLTISLAIEATQVADGDGATLKPERSAGEVRWPLALKLAAMAAVICGGLFVAGSVLPGLTGLGLLFLLTAASLVVGRYRMLAPTEPMHAGVGAKIGLSTGLLLVAVLALAMSAVGVIARFRLHEMAAFDAQWAAQSALLLDRLRAVGPVSPEVLHMVNAPEFRAGEMLSGMAILGALLLGLSAAAGALAGNAIKHRTAPL